MLTELTEILKQTPRVEECIDAVMKRFPGESTSSQARYFEEVHQYLAPLARSLELELQAANAAQAAAWEQLTQSRRAANSVSASHAKTLAIAVGALEAMRDSAPGPQSEAASRALRDIEAAVNAAGAAPSLSCTGDPT